MKKILFFASVLLSLTGCTIYHPQAVDIPLINHAGDTRLDVSASMSMWAIPDAFNLNTTVSHGFTDHFAGQLHANYGGDNYYLQAAPGLYFPLGANSVVELYAGYGYGGADRETEESETVNDNGTTVNRDSWKFGGHYHLPFAQINFGWHDLTAAHFDFGFGLKAGAFMPDYEYREFASDGTEIASRYEHYTDKNLLLEPQVIVRFGSKNVRFNVMLGFAWMSEWENNNTSNMLYDVITGSAGLTFCF